MSTTFYNLAFVTLEGGVPQAEAALQLPVPPHSAAARCSAQRSDQR